MDFTELRREYDCLYGEIQLPAILWKIIYTKEFQRLRRIKQLGGVDYVFKDATHTRYQHSIGTAYLAGLMVENLIEKKIADINEHDKICVQIAALCHDLGHGPFSYVFREKVLPQLGLDPSKQKELAYKIFKKIWEIVVTNEPILKDVLAQRDMHFIKELISGIPENTAPARYGRDGTKKILYEIFSNKNIPLDVCKFDYMARDCMNFGILTGTVLEHLRSIRSETLVMMVEGEIVRNSGLIKYCDDLCELHEKAYQSARVNAIEHMISDAFVWSDGFLHISNCMTDIDLFCEFDDGILAVMKYANDVDKRAKDVLRRIDDGEFYEFVAELLVYGWWDIESVTDIMKEFGVNPESVRMSKLRDIATKNRGIEKNQKVIQVFCVNPNEKEQLKGILQDAETSTKAWKVLPQ